NPGRLRPDDRKGIATLRSVLKLHQTWAQACVDREVWEGVSRVQKTDLMLVHVRALLASTKWAEAAAAARKLRDEAKLLDIEPAATKKVCLVRAARGLALCSFAAPVGSEQAKVLAEEAFSALREAAKAESLVPTELF